MYKKIKIKKKRSRFAWVNVLLHFSSFFFFFSSPFTRPHRETLLFQNAELTVRDSDSLAGPLVAVLNKWIITHWPKINFLTRSFIASFALHPFLGCNNLNVEFCFIWQEVKGLQALGTASQVIMRKLLQGGEGWGVRIHTDFGTRGR